MRANDTSVDVLLPFSTDLELRRRFMVLNDDVLANLRFGLLLEHLDKLAEDTALAYARRAVPGARVVTAALDDVVSRTPAHRPRHLALHAPLNREGQISMAVRIR